MRPTATPIHNSYWAQNYVSEVTCYLLGFTFFHSCRTSVNQESQVIVVSTHRGRAWADEGSTLGPDRHARDIESLDRYAMERWEIILQFMVGSPSAVSQDLAQLLVQAGLMKRYAVVFMSHSHFTCNVCESKKIQDCLFATCRVV